MGRPQYFQYYDSPLGKILLVATDYGLSGAWFEGQKYYAENFNTEAQRAKSEYVGRLLSGHGAGLSGVHRP